jgi:hypothetical protein
MRRTRRLVPSLAVWLLLLGAVTISGVGPSLNPAPAVASGASAGGLSVFVGYAEDKETNNPDPAAFPTPWAGSSNTTFLGGPVPGQSACGTLPTCYDTGAIRLDNPTGSPIRVDNVAVDIHSSITGGKLFPNPWGSFTVPAGQSVILAANPPNNNPGYDNFDTSGYPANTCTPVTVAPTVTVTIGAVGTTLVDSSHVLDTGGIDAGYCGQNESIQWRQIGAPGVKTAALSLGPATVTQFTGQPVTETATLLDGSGAGLPNATVNFAVTGGPDAGLKGAAVTNSSGLATFSFTGAGAGEDLLSATVTTVGSFQANSTRVLWTGDSAAGWTGVDIGGAVPAGTQTLDTTTGTWTLQGGGSGLSGTSDQLHVLAQTLAGDGGVAAHVTAQTGAGPPAATGVMLRASTAANAPYYAALVIPGGGTVVQERAAPGHAPVTLATQPGAVPAYLWVGRSGGTFEAYTSTDGYLWYPVPGSTASLSLGSPVLAGLAVTSGSSSALATSTMDTIVVTATPPAPLPPISCPSPWTCQDIGNPTTAGGQSYDPNTATWTVSGGGTDITGTSDQFRFVSQPLTGDGSVSAHLTSQTVSSTAAKAGVMLRDGTDPGAANYAAVVTPGQGIKVQVRSSLGASTTKIANPTGTVPQYLKVARSGSTFTAYTSPDGVTWTLIAGSTASVSMSSSLLAGVAVTSHNSGSLSTVTADTVLAAPMAAPPPTCPSPWSCADIGNPTPAGSQSYDTTAATWTINAGGSDISGSSDQFRLVSQPLTGDGSLSAHITSQTNTSSSAKAGVMLRVSTDPGSPNYAVLVSPGTGTKVQVRSTQGGATTKLANPAGTVPAYLEVTRSGTIFSAYTSPDGLNWTLIAGSTISLNFPATLLQGLAVTSHNSAALGTVTIDSVNT